MQYYNVHKSAAEIEDIVSVMTSHFSSKPGTYYSDALFFLSLGLHRIASPQQDLAIMLDADTKFRADVKELFREFDNFGKEALFGLGPELTPVYRHVLYIYRNNNPKTSFGEPAYLGGYPGYNSGVILVNLKKLRESLEYDQIVSRDSVEHMVDKYIFKVRICTFRGAIINIPFLGNYILTMILFRISGAPWRSRFFHLARDGKTGTDTHDRLWLESSALHLVERSRLRGGFCKLLALQFGDKVVAWQL